MRPRSPESRFLIHPFDRVIAIFCAALLFLAANSTALAQQAQSQVMTTTTTEEAPKIPNDQLDSLVAPIALYPDPLLSQTLVASTYPLEIVQLQQWMEKNNNLKGTGLANAVEKQNWDPSIQAMAALPAVVWVSTTIALGVSDGAEAVRVGPGSRPPGRETCVRRASSNGRRRRGSPARYPH